MQLVSVHCIVEGLFESEHEFQNGTTSASL